MPKIIELHFPMGGLNKALAFQRQPPYTSPHLMNVRPSDVFLGRARGGSRPGLEKVFAAVLGSGNPIRLLSSITYVPAGGSLTTLEVASSNGVFYKESAGNLVTIGGSLTLASDRPLRSAERLQKLWIADNKILASGTDGEITGGTTFDSATFTNWTAVAGLTAADCILENVTAGTLHRITTVASGTLTLTDSGANASGLTFKLHRAAKYYDPAANALVLAWATDGTIPVGCHLVCRFRDRLLWAGDPQAPNNIFASAVAAPLNYDYSLDVSITTRAWNLVATDAGAMGDPVTALIPHTDGCCIVGCTKSLHVIRSDPGRTGSIHPLSHRMGIVDGGAWCRTPSGWLYFLSLQGLMCMPPGCGSTPFAISDDTIPEDLLSIDRSTTTVSMEWDTVDKGIHLMLSPTSGSTPATHYFITTQTESANSPRSQFFPVKYPFTMEPTSLFSRDDSVAAGSKVHLGCRDGYVRRHLDTAATDDGQPFRSCVTIGPMTYADLFDGMLKELTTVLGGDSGAVEWSCHVGRTAEDAAEADPHSQGLWTKGINPRNLPRARGAWYCLKLASNEKWTVEKINAVVEKLGRSRL